MTLLKTSFLSLISTIFKVVSGLVINKAIAVFIGPQGLGLIGQFQNFLQLAMTLAKGGIDNGVVKYVAEFKGNPEKLRRLLGTSTRYSCFCAILSGLIVALLSGYFSERIFQSEEYKFVFWTFGFTIVLFVLNNLLLFILTGLREIGFYVKINIFQSILSLFFTSFLIWKFGLKGALVALVTNQSVTFFFAMLMLKDNKVIFWRDLTAQVDYHLLGKLLRFAIITLVSSLAIPISQMIIRNHIGQNISWGAAGCWQAVTYISNVYLMVITTSINVYFLPRLSELHDPKLLKKEIYIGHKVILPMVFIGSIAIFWFRFKIVGLLFSNQFAPAVDLFAFQMIGDVIKIASWLLGNLLLAKAMTGAIIFSEIFFSLTLTIFSVFCIDKFGLVGVSYAYAFNYFLYWLFVVKIGLDFFKSKG